MNIILKAFGNEFSKEILERCLRDIHIETCIFIENHEEQKPDIHMKEYIWMNATPLMDGQYQNIDWNTITPLDEELLESMQNTEAVFLMQIERYAHNKNISYRERKRQYLHHLRFWNHTLTTKNIQLLLMNNIPHQCYDQVLYDLCKLKNIPTFHIERYDNVDACSLEEDWESSGIEIRRTLEILQKEYTNENKEISLSPIYEEYFQSYAHENTTPWYMLERSKRQDKQSFFLKWIGISAKMLIKNPIKFLRLVASPSVWARKKRQHRAATLYDQYTAIPDLSQQYIYAPLHEQPEATTCPMAGAFSDQQLIVQLIAKCLPEGVRIYVKEHPAQGERCRNEEFYKDILSIPSVTLVPRSFSTFALMDSAAAIATATGTAGFEGLFRGKPVLMFGHRFYQYAHGVYRIKTTEDCTNAFQQIFTEHKTPSLRSIRLFLKAIETCTNPHVGGQRTDIPNDQKAKMMGEMIAKKLESFV